MRNGQYEPNDFRKAIRHLRSGVPSPLAARLVTVGTKQTEDELNGYHSSWSIGARTGLNMAFILADWGFGKTHLRMLLVDSLLSRELPFVHDHVDGKSGSLAHLQRTVPRWMETIQVGAYSGIRSVVESSLKDMSRVSKWCRSRNTSFALNLEQAIHGREWAWNLVAGHQFQYPDYSYYHLQAFEILLDAAALMASFSPGGITLLLDEAENISRQHDIRGRRKSYATLGRLAHEQHLFSIVFVTDRFFAQVHEDLQRGLSNGWALWPEEARKFLSRIQTIPVITPPRIDRNLARAIVEKIVGVYSKGFQCKTPATFTDAVLLAWTKTATRSIRLLVRLTVDALDRIAP